MRGLAFAAFLVAIAVMAALIDYPNFKRLKQHLTKESLRAGQNILERKDEVWKLIEGRYLVDVWAAG